MTENIPNKYIFEYECNLNIWEMENSSYKSTSHNFTNDTCANYLHFDRGQAKTVKLQINSLREHEHENK